MNATLNLEESILHGYIPKSDFIHELHNKRDHRGDFRIIV